VYRENQIWRDIRTKGQDATLLRQECLYRNRVVVKYPVAEALLDPPLPGSDDAQHPQ